MRVHINLIILLAFISCNKDKPEGNVQSNPAFANELTSSPSEIQIGINIFYLKAGLWRDFMPQSPKDGKPLICINDLTEKDSLPIPANIKLIKQYVINGNNIWTNNYSEINNWISFTLEGTVRDGPKWGPGISVDVVCEFQIGSSVFRIIAKQQKITATY